MNTRYNSTPPLAATEYSQGNVPRSDGYVVAEIVNKNCPLLNCMILYSIHVPWRCLPLK